MKKNNETSPKETDDKLTTIFSNSSGQSNMHKQWQNVHTNHITVDEQFEPPKERYEIESLKEQVTGNLNAYKHRVKEHFFHPIRNEANNI